MADEIYRVEAPFAPEQVRHLNAFQSARVMHPFTCPTAHEEGRDLVATLAGWICPHCDYRQSWAHSFMADGSAVAGHRRMFATAGLQRAWRDGFRSARECLSENEASCLTVDVEQDAWLDSETKEYITAAQGMSTGTAKTPKAVEGRSPASPVAEGDAPVSHHQPRNHP